MSNRYGELVFSGNAIANKFAGGIDQLITDWFMQTVFKLHVHITGSRIWIYIDAIISCRTLRRRLMLYSKHIGAGECVFNDGATVSKRRRSRTAGARCTAN